MGRLGIDRAITKQPTMELDQTFGYQMVNQNTQSNNPLFGNQTFYYQTKSNPMKFDYFKLCSIGSVV